MQSSPIDTYHLGAAQRTYTFSSIRFTLSIIGLLLIGVFFTYMAIQIFLGDPTEYFYTILPIMLGGGAFIYIIILINQAMKTAGTRVTVYEKGFVFASRETTQIVTWDEIETIWAHMHRVQIEIVLPILLGFKMRIRCVDGREITIPRQLGHVLILADNILDNTDERIARQDLAKIEKGEVVRYGDIFQVTQEYLGFAGRKILWNKVINISLSQASVSVQAQGDIMLNLRNAFVTTPMYKVPNYFAFLMIAGHFIHKSRQ